LPPWIAPIATIAGTMVQAWREIKEARSLTADLLGPGPSPIHRARMDEKAMEKSETGSGLFQWIVGGLLAVIAVLAGAIYNDMRGSIKEAVDGLSTFKIEVVKQLGDIKIDNANIRSDIAAFKGEVVKQLGDMKAEIGATNSRLDQVVDRLDRLRTR
jgi:hypothetical protein